ncbi:aminotransferase class V-fold PLP-dependent enzyme [candidate division WOR-3 bacterium]|uniref:Aminotransferase class V-fold PLP-dependent enzyme n=1 Tax=candidate division WOR-3 bacterium TaxID=2052148 RepID=A0A9D5K9A2_UNCW3|nr:aminotransferase class V-fold PLP-dependent enzyme [candidate division WOR-3 bacterium]MBD3364688.1 aminotransferase class V-fold PLP-dependent enzyme [candidate division WOR-3 bacterium]
MNEIYLDNATTTRVDQRALEEMKHYFTEEFAAPTGHFGHQASLDAKEKLEEARAIIAGSINAEPEEIVFTSGGTEANNLAIQGLIRSKKGKRHVVTTAIEHESVLNTFRALEKAGQVELTLVGVDKDGFVKVDELSSTLRSDTALCSVHLVNHEVGTVQPVAEIGRICEEKGVPFHVDAVHGWGYVPFNVGQMYVSLASLTAHKIHGPKGVGAMFRRKGLKLGSLMYGGYNEFELRPGMENLPGIVGMAKAISMIKPEHTARVGELRSKMWNSIDSSIPWVHLNGSADNGAPHILNVTFDYIEGESILLHLDMEGVAAATGSACFSKALEASYVLLAMGRPHEQAHGSMRFSFSRFNTTEEIDKSIKILKRVVTDLRKLSPLTPEED